MQLSQLFIKIAEFDALVSLVEAKQSVANNASAISLLDQIALLYNQFTNGAANVPNPSTHRQQAEIAFEKLGGLYRKIIQQLNQVLDIAGSKPEVQVFVESAQSSINESLVYLKEQYAEPEPEHEQVFESQYEEETPDENDPYRPPDAEPHPEAVVYESPFLELEKQTQDQITMALNTDLYKKLEQKRNSWRKLFGYKKPGQEGYVPGSAKPIDKELWLQAVEEATNRFGNFGGISPLSFALKWYRENGGSFVNYHDLHLQRRNEYHAKLKSEDPVKYLEYLDQERERRRRYKSDEQIRQKLKEVDKKSKIKVKREKENAKLDELSKLLEQYKNNLT